MNFYPILTEDSSITLFNLDYDDVYHSKVGAYTEAIYKYVAPSGLIEFIKNNNEVRILDVCFGLGYNAKTAVNEIIKNSPETKIHITALEIDPVILSLSTILGTECFNEDINYCFFSEINKHVDIQQIIDDYLQNTAHIRPEIQSKTSHRYILVKEDELRQKLHNIYYRSISTRNSIDKKAGNSNINIEFHVNDARFSAQKLDQEYDFIFLDPFTPSKTPNLWTVDFFKLLFNLLSPDGNITTYSNAAPVRTGLIEAGFYIGTTTPIGKKTTGTIAFKNHGPVKNKLSEKEEGILNTKAGVPYRDEGLNSTNKEILDRRQAEKQNSDKISSSKFLKTHKNLSEK